MKVPPDRRYAETHEWFLLDDAIVTMGISQYAADELTGLIVAAALVRPDKKLGGLTTESVLKRFKEPAFAAGANRDQIKTCESQLGVPLPEFTEVILNSMKDISKEIGL